MRVGLRALLALALLAGVYLLAAAVAGFVVVAVILALQHPNIGTFKITVLSVLAAAAVARGLWESFAADRDAERPGVSVTREEQPALWALVDDLAADVGTRPPDDLRFIPAVNAAVVEEGHQLGLRAGRRTMYVGLPLVQGMTVDELRAVLAHELGHYSGRHTALGPVIRRGHVALESLVGHLSSRRITRWIFLNYAKLYFRLSRGVSRRQELEADAEAARIGGRDSAVSALSRLPGLSAAWEFYLATYVSPAIRVHRAPARLLGGFSALLAEPDRQQELAAVGVPETTKANPYDTHPPLSARIAALRKLADETSLRSDVPAATVIADAGALDEAMPRMLLTQSLPLASWEEIAQRAAQEENAAVASALLRSVDEGDGATLETVLETISAGKGEQIAKVVAPRAPKDDEAAVLGWSVEQLVVRALDEQGRVQWTVGWTGDAWQPDVDLDLVKLRERITAAVAAPAKMAALRKFLTGQGVDLDYTSLKPQTDPYAALRDL